MCVCVTPHILAGMCWTECGGADWCRPDFRAARASRTGSPSQSKSKEKEASVQTGEAATRLASTRCGGGKRGSALLCCGSGYKSPLVPVIMATFHITHRVMMECVHLMSHCWNNVQQSLPIQQSERLFFPF